MISRQHECIFIHQRKCAGQAVIRTFGLLPNNPDFHCMNDGVLSPEYERRPADYFIFSIVHNPWDRFVSGWKYCASTRLRALRDVLRNRPPDGHDHRHLTRPQVDILFDREGRPVTDFLMRYESIQQDFDMVCDRLAKSRRGSMLARAWTIAAISTTNAGRCSSSGSPATSRRSAIATDALPPRRTG